LGAYAVCNLLGQLRVRLHIGVGKIIVAVAIIVAAIIIAQAIGGAGENIRSGLLQLGDALR